MEWTKVGKPKETKDGINKMLRISETSNRQMLPTQATPLSDDPRERMIQMLSLSRILTVRSSGLLEEHWDIEMGLDIERNAHLHELSQGLNADRLQRLENRGLLDDLFSQHVGQMHRVMESDQCEERVRTVQIEMMRLCSTNADLQESLEDSGAAVNRLNESNHSYRNRCADLTNQLRNLSSMNQARDFLDKYGLQMSPYAGIALITLTIACVNSILMAIVAAVLMLSILQTVIQFWETFKESPIISQILSTLSALRTVSEYSQSSYIKIMELLSWR
ncbi:MAG: hypothetical protein ACI9YB_001703 [Halioglobus sp.]|jgi:hypothetical protein